MAGAQIQNADPEEVRERLLDAIVEYRQEASATVQSN
jgi:hypothetical protein